jgi:hypothetical protein
VPITGLEELDKHLDELVDNPSIELNAKLLDHVELQLTGTASALPAELCLGKRRRTTGLTMSCRREYPPADPAVPPEAHHDPQAISARSRSPCQPVYQASTARLIHSGPDACV